MPFGLADKLGVQGKKVKSNNDLEVILFSFPLYFILFELELLTT